MLASESDHHISGFRRQTKIYHQKLATQSPRRFFKGCCDTYLYCLQSPTKCSASTFYHLTTCMPVTHTVTQDNIQCSNQCYSNMMWAGVHILQYRVPQLTFSFYSPYSEKVTEIFSFGSQTNVTSNKHVFFCLFIIMAVKVAFVRKNVPTHSHYVKETVKMSATQTMPNIWNGLYKLITSLMARPKLEDGVSDTLVNWLHCLVSEPPKHLFSDNSIFTSNYKFLHSINITQYRQAFILTNSIYSSTHKLYNSELSRLV
jgi:hypothetical protein